MEGNKKSSKIWLIAFILAAVVALGAVGYIIYSKISKSDNPVDNNSQTSKNIDGEIADKTICNLFAEKLDVEINLDPNILADMKGGKPSEWTDFEKVYIVMNSTLSNWKLQGLTCGEADMDACFDSDFIKSTAQEIYGDNVTINNSNFAQFKNYPFDPISNDVAHFDASKNTYIIPNLLAGHGGDYVAGYIKVPYKLVKSGNNWKLSYYLIYVEPNREKCDNHCVTKVGQGKGGVDREPGYDDTFLFYPTSAKSDLLEKYIGDDYYMNKVEEIVESNKSKLNIVTVSFVISADRVQMISINK
ncbi:MAG: hypothetical protein LBQ11_01060 [Candidatus Nomurabacteria bacterium]|nr:hypothetical protein [Candidatus Nomurabacteria bacterium]